MSDDLRLDIPIRIDYSRFDRDLQSVYASLRRLERETVTIDIAADDSSLRGLQGQIDGLDATADVRVNASSSDLDNIERRVSGLGETVNLRVNATGNDLQEIEDDLNRIKNLATITVALNVAGAGLNAVTGLAETFGSISGVGGLFEVNEALIRLEGTTGRIIPGARELIRDLFTSGWGESQTQIAGVIEQATNLRVPFEELPEAVESALRLVAINSEYSTNEYLRTQRQLVQNGLAQTYTEAADIIVAGLQNGLDGQEDLLDTLFEYAPDFADFQLTGEQVVNAIGNGMANGFRNSDLAADAIREFQTRLINDFQKPEFQDALDILGQLDEAEAFKAGELTGAELLSGVTGAIGDLLASGEIDLANQLAAILFGSQAEDIGARGISALDPFVEYVNTEIPGAAERASDQVITSFSAITERIGRIISTGIGDQLDAALDITGRLQAAEAGASAFFDALESGSDLGTAAGVGLRVAGLDELQSSLAGFVLDFLSGLAEFIGFLDSIPGVDINTEGLDRTITRLAGGQLEIELSAADDGQEITDAVNRAIERGVDETDAINQVGEALQNALGAGEIDTARGLNDYLLNLQEAQAQTGELSERFQEFQTIVNQLADLGVSDSRITGLLSNSGFSEEEIQRFRDLQMVGESLAEIDLSNLVVDFTEFDSSAIQTALDNFDFEGALDIARSLDPSELAAVFATAAEEANTQLTTLLSPLALTTAREGFLSGDAEQRATAFGLFEDLQTLQEQGVTTNESVLTSLRGMREQGESSMQLFGASFSLAAQEIDAETGDMIRVFGETGVASDLLAGAGVQGSKDFALAWATELDGVSISLGLFNSQVFDTVNNLGALVAGGAALTGLNLGGGGGGGNTTNNTVNANINTQSQAEANATGNILLNAFN